MELWSPTPEAALTTRKIELRPITVLTHEGRQGAIYGYALYRTRDRSTTGVVRPGRRAR